MIDTIRASGEQPLELRAVLDAAGAPIMASSDCPACALIAGQSLQDKLALYVEAGMSPLRALWSATIDAATFLGLNADLGTLEVGKFADMVAMDDDPVHRIDALRKDHVVVAAGNWHSRSALTAEHFPRETPWLKQSRFRA